MKKYAQLVGLLSLLLTFTACSSIKTYTDYDNTVSFNTYKSYAFYDNMNTGLDSLNQARFTQALTTTLAQKGIEVSTTPDFKINFYSKLEEVTRQQNIGIGIGSYGAHVAGNVTTGIPIRSTKKVLRITIEFADAKTNTLLWESVVEGKYKSGRTPEQRITFYQKMAEKALAEYPPKATK